MSEPKDMHQFSSPGRINQSLVAEHGGGGGGGELARPARAARAWPCCDDCGGCTKSIPPQCQCLDAAPRGCHPACRDCVKSSLSADPPVYQCMDRVPNFCQRRCTAATAAH
ncbi:Bowman-Birk type trypsin inhibitor-like isoform X2 [Phragmites australis]|uniref:Bowman-Birk type trypsin inhibitor-like isoform X2 n=1 Tax=Phragmites australis TaxID=29695 RepID=UPI002D78162E|nr:Bowman-Birk type trypsin inhibitor-like isoform X2 [Phragmites australis]